MDQSKNEGLQIGRAIAALSVAYFHSYIALRWFPAANIHPFAPLAAGGFFGVNFFFAISGYVISVVTDRPQFTAASFLIKRVFRLYPLVIVFCLFQYWLHVAPIVDVTVDHSWSRILYGMTLLPGSGERYYAVTWTLEHEVIFYLLAAMIVPRFGRMWLAALLAALASVAYFVKPEFGDIHIFTMVHADFLAGILAYQYREGLGASACGCHSCVAQPCTISDIKGFNLRCLPVLFWRSSDVQTCASPGVGGRFARLLSSATHPIRSISHIGYCSTFQTGWHGASSPHGQAPRFGGSARLLRYAPFRCCFGTDLRSRSTNSDTGFLKLEENVPGNRNCRRPGDR